MRKAYAADFGAGNTCLYSTRADVSIREATSLNTPGGEPSGYAAGKRGDVLLGMGLYALTYRNLERIEQFHINLKAHPTEANARELTGYFRSWLEKMQKDHPEEFQGVDQKYWFIGCPTGGEWKKKETRDLYVRIFEEAGYENVYIVPESNAALAFYQHKDRILDEYSEHTKLLLIDQGAYSLDATNYSAGKVTSYGGYLGASIVERMLVHVILYEKEEDIRLKKRVINYPQALEEARRLYEQDGVRGKFYTYLLLQARMLKEDYFTQWNNNTLVQTTDLTRALDFEVDGDQLVLFTNPKIMENILEKLPVRQVLGAEFSTLAPEVQKEIGGQTWMQAFRSFLDHVDLEYQDLGKGDNTIIMLTGGGSLMNCVAEAVREHYPSASVHCDKEAISAIGKGLAYWAPDKIRAIDFRKAFEAFANREVIDKDGDSVNNVSKRLYDVFADCTVTLVRDIIAEEADAVRHGIGQWRSYACNSSEIPDKIEAHLKNWCDKTGKRSFIDNIESRVADLKVELNTEFNQAIKSFELEEFELLKKDDVVFLSDWKRLMPLCFALIVEGIAKHYKDNDIWTNFPDSRKKLFSDPRTDFFNKIEAELNDWLDRETSSTVKLCQYLFLEYEFKIADDVSWTIARRFHIEGKFDLFNLMEKHVKEILGKLVIEEYIDDDA